MSSFSSTFLSESRAILERLDMDALESLARGLAAVAE